MQLGFYENVTLGQCEEMFPRKAERMAELLDSMTHRGTVFTEQKTGPAIGYIGFCRAS